MKGLPAGRAKRPGGLADLLNATASRRRRLEKRGALPTQPVRVQVLGGPSSATPMDRPAAP